MLSEANIVYQDRRLVAIDKPAGWLVHRTAIARQETRFVVQWLRDRLGRRVHPVHRLDRATSGLLLFALDEAAARHLGAQFEAGAVRKTYLAIVRGWPPAEGRIDHPLKPPADVYSREATLVRPAVTDYRRLATVELPQAVDRYASARYALLALLPLTGRQHQLRRHLKHIAHPVIGDVRYGKGSHNRFFASHFDCRRLLLASVALAFRHPDGDAPTRLCTPPGDAFAAVLERLGWLAAATDAMQTAAIGDNPLPANDGG